MNWEENKIEYVIFAIVVAVGFFKYVKFMKSGQWAKAEGVIEALDVEQFHGSNSSGGTMYSYKPIARYRYNVDGQTYESNDIFPVSIGGAMDTETDARKIIEQYEVGQSVVVYYNPVSKEDACLITAAQFPMAFKVAMGLILIAIAAVIFIVIGKVGS